MTAQLTVGLIAGDLRARAECSLSCLLNQTALDRMEIVVVDIGHREGAFAGAAHPRVRYIRRPDFRHYCEAQAEVVRQARTPLVAFVEDHCYATPGWAQAVLETFENPRVAAVNYTFTPAGNTGYLGRSILMAEYGNWMFPHPGGRVRICSSTNLAYRRKVLLEEIRGRESLFEAEFLVQRAIARRGMEIHLAPRATLAHESWSTLRDACAANGANKRVLGSRRSELGGWGPFRRAVWAAAMGLAPGLFLARLAWSLRRRPALWVTYLTGLPVMTAIYCACAWHEAKGYLWGAGQSREELAARELAVSRNA